jgi:hypothetical protein
MLLGSALSKLPPSHAAYLTGHTFFPSLISAPFQHGLDIAFDFAIIACLIAALASLMRGRRYVHDEDGQATDEGTRAMAGADEGTRAMAGADEGTRAVAADGPVAARTIASTVGNRTADNSTAHAVAVTSGGDDLEGIQGRVGRVGDPASVGGDLA